MTLSKNTQHTKIFDQDDYDNVFSYCEDNHPFVAFTTCYCPLCDSIDELDIFTKYSETLEEEFDDLDDKYSNLVSKAYKIAPEILI